MVRSMLSLALLLSGAGAAQACDIVFGQSSCFSQSTVAVQTTSFVPVVQQQQAHIAVAPVATVFVAAAAHPTTVLVAQQACHSRARVFGGGFRSRSVTRTRTFSR